MTRSATDVMQEIIFSAVIDAIGALKASSKGVPNTMLRDLNSVHANTTFADLPPELQAAIGASVRSAFTRLLKEGYSVSPGQPAQQQRSAPRRDDQRERRPGPRRDGPGPRREGQGPRKDGPGEGRRGPPRGGPGGARPGGSRGPGRPARPPRGS
jgi:hypothetical protein